MARPETTQGDGDETHGNGIGQLVREKVQELRDNLEPGEHGIGRALSEYIHAELGRGQGGQGDTTESETDETDTSDALANSSGSQEAETEHQFQFADTNTSRSSGAELSSTQQLEDALDHAGSHAPVELPSFGPPGEIVEHLLTAGHLPEQVGWLVS